MAQVISTHHLFKELKSVGFEEKQAEQVINTIETMQDARLEDVATKADLLGIKADLLAVKTELKADIRLLHWGVALIIVVVGIPALKSLFG